MGSTPAHIVLTPTDNSNLVNFMNLDNIGISTLKDSTAFKKIQFFSKTNPTSLFNVKSDFQNSLNKLNTLFLNDLDLNQSYTYGMDRQHNYTSLSSTLPMFSTLMDSKSTEKFFSYNLNHNWNNNNVLDINRVNYNINTPSSLLQENLINNYNQKLPESFKLHNILDFSSFLKIPNVLNVISTE